MTSDHVRQAGPIVIDIENITKDYVMGEEIVHALRGVTLQIRRNEYIAVMGPSGSGKSTLMNMLGCLDTPTSGRYEFNGKNVAEMNDDELAAIRNREIGFVFQTFNLLPRSTSLRNVELPLIYAGMEPEARAERATQANIDKCLGRAFCARFGLHSRVDQWKLNIAKTSGARKQVKCLKNKADLPISNRGEFVIVHLGNVATIKFVAAGCGCIEASKHIHEGRFAATAGPHHSDIFVGANL